MNKHKRSAFESCVLAWASVSVKQLQHKACWTAGWSWTIDTESGFDPLFI